MPSLADLLENYRNWKGRQDWQSGKEMQDYFGGDPVAQEQFEKLSGFGTADLGGLSGLAGAIKASHGSPHAFDLSFVPEGNKIRNYKIGNSTIVLDARPDKIGISSIRTPVSKRGQGSAKNALSQLVEQADAEGIPLSLSASPLDKKTSLQKLFDFYQSMGFEPTGSKVNVLGHPEMIRYPKVPAKSIWTNADSIHEYGYWPDQ